MKLDFGTVLVAVMTLAVAVFLVWLELHSRRNAKQQPPGNTKLDNAAPEAQQDRQRRRK